MATRTAMPVRETPEGTLYFLSEPIPYEGGGSTNYGFVPVPPHDPFDLRYPQDIQYRILPADEAGATFPHPKEGGRYYLTISENEANDPEGSDLFLEIDGPERTVDPKDVTPGYWWVRWPDGREDIVKVAEGPWGPSYSVFDRPGGMNLKDAPEDRDDSLIWHDVPNAWLHKVGPDV